MNPTKTQHEDNPLDAMHARFDVAAEKLGLDRGLYEILKVPDREISVAIPVQMDDGSLRVFRGYRVQHSVARGPGKGGIRFAPDVNLDEVRGAGRLDDVEVRGGQRALRRREGVVSSATHGK